MFKKLLLSLFILVMLVGCNSPKDPSDDDPTQGCDIIEDCGDEQGSGENMSFKEAYESLNGTETKSGKLNRSVEIPADHPFVRVAAKEIVKRIGNKETFYVYLGDELCPWCRSVIEKAIEVSKQAGIDTIYYVKIWDEEGSEIFRDRYVLEEGKPVLSIEADPAYYQLLEYWQDYLDDYTLTDEDGKEVAVNEKRIYVPTFVYIEDGQIRKLVTGISDLQEDSREELNAEILSEEEAIFTEFFNNKN